MLKHLHNEHKEPSRVVILGANGFVGNSVVKYLLASDINVLALTRDDIDLASSNACSKLTRILDSQDSIVFVSARAPVKNNQMLIDNLKMADVVCEALGQTPINHLIYISSDAVYADSEIPLTEESVRGPNSLHGVMHLAREVMLQESIESPMCILRPTLIYGSSDPHNSYGPNRFVRQILSNENIQIFGDGEEQRDHVWIEDVAATISHVLMRKTVGELNVCSGYTVSFAEIVEMLLKVTNSEMIIENIPRSGPMPHNGFRPIDITRLIDVFPGFIPVHPLVGIKNCIDEFRQTLKAANDL